MLFQIILTLRIITSCLVPCFPGHPDSAREYDSVLVECNLSYKVFGLAIKGLQNTDRIKNKNIITIIDYSKPSNTERFFVIDLENKKLLYKTCVAHGKNTGENMAVSFSNKPGSLQSSLGFFRTAETIYCDKGYSLCIDGLEAGINDNARKRSIIIHGAFYADPEFVAKYGYTGRSWGCPALPRKLTKEIIDTIKGGTCIFIYGDSPDYIAKSTLLKGSLIDGAINM